MPTQKGRKRFGRVGLVLKAYTAGLALPTNKIIRELERQGIEVIVDEAVAALFPRQPSASIAKMEVDFILTVGGDGTILRTLQANPAPVFALNAGVVGFLAEAPLTNGVEAVRRVLRGEFVLERRMRITPQLSERRLAPCINEVVLHTASVAKMVHFQVSVDGNLVTRTRADGVIVSTPTGSTSYSLSVGGPIVDPAVEAFVLCPIAPFTLHSRPIVLPASSRIEVRMVEHRPAVLVLDGQVNLAFSKDDLLTMRRAKDDAKLIRFEPDFYKRLREKHSITI